MTNPKKWFLRFAIVLTLAVVGYFGWQWVKPPSLPAGIASANGRIEATDIDVATRHYDHRAGRELAS